MILKYLKENKKSLIHIYKLLDIYIKFFNKFMYIEIYSNRFRLDQFSTSK